MCTNESMAKKNGAKSWRCTATVSSSPNLLIFRPSRTPIYVSLGGRTCFRSDFFVFVWIFQKMIICTPIVLVGKCYHGLFLSFRENFFTNEIRWFRKANTRQTFFFFVSVPVEWENQAFHCDWHLNIEFCRKTSRTQVRFSGWCARNGIKSQVFLHNVMGKI